MAPDSRLDRRQDQSIAAVYSAANGERTWEDALSQVMNCLSACGGQMVGINSSNGRINFSFASQKVVGDIELEYIRHYHQVDPRIPILLNRPLGQWLIDQDEFPPDVFDNNEYYRDLLAPEDCLYTATVRLYEDPHEMVLMAAVMPRDSAGFGLAQREYLRIIVPHLMEAVRLFRKNSKHAASDVAARKLIEHIKRPVVVIDDARAISMANLQGRTLLGRSEVLFEPDGHLVATRSDDEFALTCAIADLRRTMNTGTMGERALVRLRGGRRDSFAVSLIAFDPPTSMHAFGIRRQFMLSVHGGPSMPEPDPYLWQAAFDLTPAEARLATLIFQGNSCVAAAKILGVAPSTANFHLDAVFVKTKTSRQADLVRVLTLTLD